MSANRIMWNAEALTDKTSTDTSPTHGFDLSPFVRITDLTARMVSGFGRRLSRHFDGSFGV
jgi:hypothetical protein